jgi:hypothetical protein
MKSALLYSSHKGAREFYAKGTHMTIEVVVVYNALFVLNYLLGGILLLSAWFVSITTHHFSNTSGIC